MLFTCEPRSHTIFTSIVEHMQKWDASIRVVHDSTKDFVCAKLHVFDFAGLEQAKRMGADGIQFKEGIVLVPTSRLLYSPL